MITMVVVGILRKMDNRCNHLAFLTIAIISWELHKLTIIIQQASNINLTTSKGSLMVFLQQQI